MIFLKQLNIKFLLFKKLSLLGLFRIKRPEFVKENNFYNIHLSYTEQKICSISLKILFNNINKFYPLMNLLLLKNNLFLFINIDKYSDSFLTKFFYTLLKKIKAYSIYDWGYGLLTNFSKTYYEFFLEERAQLHKLPDVVFLLRILEKQHYIMTEIQHSGTVSLGLVDYENSGSIDYPIPSNSSPEYSYFFFRLFAKLILNFFNNLEINWFNKKKIKRLQFSSSILLKNNNKFKFKKKISQVIVNKRKNRKELKNKNS